MTLVSLLQFKNATGPTDFTLSGISIDVSELHPINIEGGMFVTALPIVILFIALHLANANLPFSPAEAQFMASKFTVLRFLQSENAKSPILIMFFGIVIF